jgi:hypothetical protein
VLRLAPVLALLGLAACGGLLSGPEDPADPAPPTTATLSVTRSGDGVGAIVSDPAGIACGPDCTAPFATGTRVRLTADAADGSTFAGWAGCDAIDGPRCDVDVASARTVDARFDLAPATARLRIDEGACAATGVGATCTLPVALDAGSDWGGAGFTLSADDFALDAAATTGATADCLLEAGATRVGLACPDRIAAGADLVSLTLRRTAATGAPLGLADAVLLPYDGGRVAADIVTTVTPGTVGTP